MHTAIMLRVTNNKKKRRTNKTYTMTYPLTAGAPNETTTCSLSPVTNAEGDTGGDGVVVTNTLFVGTEGADAPIVVAATTVNVSVEMCVK
jgi:hypothetical protein